MHAICTYTYMYVYKADISRHDLISCRFFHNTHTHTHTHIRVFINEAHFHILHTSHCFGVNATPLWLLRTPFVSTHNSDVINALLCTFQLFILSCFPAFARSNEAVKVYKSHTRILTWIAELCRWIFTSLPMSAWVPMYSPLLLHYNASAQIYIELCEYAFGANDKLSLSL